MNSYISLSGKLERLFYALYRFRRATKDRGLSNELYFLLSYNKEFVKAFADFI